MGRWPRWGRRRLFAPARHLTALVVLVLLGVTVAGQGFGAFIAPVVSSSGAEGGERGVNLLIRGQAASGPEEVFAHAVAPMTVIQRGPLQDDPPITLDGEPILEELSTRTDVVTYTVGPGDTLYSIAQQFDIAAYTIFWVNGLHTPSDVVPEMVLTIPPISGAPHTVQPGETLESVADMFGVRPGNIVGYPYNGLQYPYRLKPGQEIFVPGGVIEIPGYPVQDGERPPPTLVQMPGGERLSWPTTGYISAPFGWSRTYGGYHRGIDIANRYGTPIYAAAAGTVVESGWGPLGYYAAIDHGNGFRTEYGHLAQMPLVSVGEEVERGQLIGYMGRTYGQDGYASGVHLHFAVRHHGVFIDPLPLLED